MNAKLISVVALLAVLVAVGSVVEAHKKFYSAPQYQDQPDRCLCDCGPPQHPIIPNKPYYGNAGYGQPPPRPSGGGYGNSGAYAVSGSYGSGGGQVSGGY